MGFESLAISARVAKRSVTILVKHVITVFIVRVHCVLTPCFEKERILKPVCKATSHIQGVECKMVLGVILFIFYIKWFCLVVNIFDIVHDVEAIFPLH